MGKESSSGRNLLVKMNAFEPNGSEENIPYTFQDIVITQMNTLTVNLYIGFFILSQSKLLHFCAEVLLVYMIFTKGI